MSSQATRIKQIKKQRKQTDKLKTQRTSAASVNNIKSKYVNITEVKNDTADKTLNNNVIKSKKWP